MDETSWLASQHLSPMLRHLRETANFHRRKAGRRKLRLFSCACARSVWDRLSEPCRSAVEAVELLVDGRLTQGEFDTRLQALHAHYQTEVLRLSVGNAFAVVWAVVSSLYLDAMAANASGHVGMVLAMQTRAERQAAGDSQEQIAEAARRVIEASNRRGCDLAREIFGNPFQPLPKRKFPAEVRGLAQACYDDPSHYPLLADALADLGEDRAADHCRLANHVRGCHVADWVLGKG